jgi:hypothetical protein
MAGSSQKRTAASDRAALLFIKSQIFCVVFLQKFAIHAGTSDIQLVLITLLVGLAALAVFDRIFIDGLRLGLFALFAACAVLAHLVGGRAFSAPSLILLLIMYPLLALYRPVGAQTQLQAIKFYQSCMIVIGLITIALQGVQYTIGAGYWPNLGNIASSAILMRGYNYFQPLSYGSAFYKPNAFFMLEVSFIQQFTAIALVLELAYFRRPLALLLFLVVIFITFAGSGLLILLFAIPGILIALRARSAIVAVVVAAAGALLLVQLGWFGQISGRLTEFTTANTSGYFRFTLPVIIFIQNLGNPEFLVTGLGAGATPEGTAFLLLPFSKMMLEYGFLSTLSFYTFLGVCLFRKAPNYLAAYVVFLQYNLGGGTLAVPMYVVLFFTLCTFFRPDRRAVLKLLEADRRRFRGVRAMLA